MICRIEYKPDDCFYEVISPLGVVVTRTVTKRQAMAFAAHSFKKQIKKHQGEEDGEEETSL